MICHRFPPTNLWRECENIDRTSFLFIEMKMREIRYCFPLYEITVLIKDKNEKTEDNTVPGKR